MHPVFCLLLVLGLSRVTVNAEDENVYEIFKTNIEVQTSEAISILELIKTTFEILKENTKNDDLIMYMNKTLTAVYESAVNVAGVDPDCLKQAKYSTDNFILDSIEELTSCQNLTQSYDKMQNVDRISDLEETLNSTRDNILTEAKKCTHGSFLSKLGCMERKAEKNVPTLESLTKIITSNFHKIGGLSLLVQIEYGACKTQELTKLSNTKAKLLQTVTDCLPATTTTLPAEITTAGTTPERTTPDTTTAGITTQETIIPGKTTPESTTAGTTPDTITAGKTTETTTPGTTTPDTTTSETTTPDTTTPDTTTAGITTQKTITRGTTTPESTTTGSTPETTTAGKTTETTTPETTTAGKTPETTTPKTATPDTTTPETTA